MLIWLGNNGHVTPASSGNVLKPTFARVYLVLITIQEPCVCLFSLKLPSTAL